MDDSKQTDSLDSDVRQEMAPSYYANGPSLKDDPDKSELDSAPAPIVEPKYLVINNSRTWRLATSWLTIGVLIALMLIASGFAIFRRSSQEPPVQSGDFDSLHLPLATIFPEEDTTPDPARRLTVNGTLQANNSIVVSPSLQPNSPVAGQLYFDQTTNQLAYYNGTAFVSAGGSNTTLIQNTTVVTGSGGASASLTAVGGAANTIPKFVTGQQLGPSLLSDDGAQIIAAGNINLVAPAGDPLRDLSLWSASTTPTNINFPDTSAVEVGMKFRTDVNGFVRGIRFYKGPANTGTHIGNLWSNTGLNLATATFSNESASGWQEVRFSSPVAIAAETTYVVSYHTTVGQYSNTDDYFLNSGADNQSLHALQNGSDGGNGVFRYTPTSAFPSQSFSGTNYWVDVIFVPNKPPLQIQFNGVQISSADLSNNTEIAKRGSSQVFTGNNTFRSADNSADAFSIQGAESNILFNVDTVAGRVYIGDPAGTLFPIVLVLSNKTTIGDPIGTEGAIYYNAEQRMFRCFRNEVWDACSELEADHGFGVYDEFMGGQVTSFAGSDSIGSLGWNAQAIGTNGSIAFNPTTPTPASNRPGVLALTTPAVANNGTTLLLGNASGGSMLLTKDVIVKTSVAISADTNQIIRVGVHNETTASAQPTSGVWWEANPSVSSRWRLCYGTGVAAVCQISSRPIEADTWVRLEIRVVETGTGTSNVIFIVNDDRTVVSGATIDTATRISPALSCMTTTASTRSCYWDYFQLKGTTAVIR